MRFFLATLLFPMAAVASDCQIPFTQLMDSKTGQTFKLQDVYNDFPAVKDMYRQRYLVVNLNTTDGAGNCKGIVEHYPAPNDSNAASFFPELNNPPDRLSYEQSVLKNYRPPVNKASTAMHGQSRVCIGQTVTMCEMRNGVAVEVAKLGTSSSDTGNSVPERGYYGEINFINTRSWGVNRQEYNASIDGPRDLEMGGVDAKNLSGPRFVPYKGWVMPNFMNFLALPGYHSNPDNGLHEISNGETYGSNLGAPVSHGCLRLTKYGAILLRWWVPRGARMFISFTPEGYRKYATDDGKAK